MSLNRRNFLKGVIAAGAAIALRPVANFGGPLPVGPKDVPLLWPPLPGNEGEVTWPEGTTTFTIPKGLAGTYLIRAWYSDAKVVEIKRNKKTIASVMRLENEGPLNSWAVSFLSEGDFVETMTYSDISPYETSIVRIGS